MHGRGSQMFLRVGDNQWQAAAGVLAKPEIWASVCGTSGRRLFLLPAGEKVAAAG